MTVTVIRSSNNMQIVYIGKVSQAQAKQDKIIAIAVKLKNTM